MSTIDKGDRALRLLAIVQCLSRKRFRTASQAMELLAARGIEVQKRTMERDLRDLSESPVFGPHIELRDDTRPYQWRLRPGCDLLMPELDADIAATWDLVGSHLEYLLPDSAQEKLSPVISRARRYLKNTSGGGWSDKVTFLPRGLLKAANVLPAVREAVYEAVVEARPVAVEYRNKRGEERSAILHIQGVVNRGTVTYVAAMWDDFEDVRHLAMHRILKARKENGKARRKPGFVLADYVKSGAFDIHIKRDAGPCRLRLRFYSGAGEHLEETPLTECQKLTRVDESTVECEAQVQDSQELRWWILGFGEHVEVLAPASLREAIGSQLAVAAARYQS